MLIICDFDGTVTARDTNSALARRFAPEAWAEVEGRLASRELTLRDVLSAEFETVTAGLDRLLDVALEIPFRPGFHEFLAAADESGARVVLLSSGFRQVIEPMLGREGLVDRVELLANEIALDETGGTITWRELPTCELCGEPCKRHDVTELRRRHADGDEQVAFVGDGMSDRCGAESADIVLARDGLARYLDERGIAYAPWDDFHDVSELLGLRDARGVAR